MRYSRSSVEFGVFRLFLLDLFYVVATLRAVSCPSLDCFFEHVVVIDPAHGFERGSVVSVVGELIVSG
jgi:hypothetical protein